MTSYTPCRDESFRKAVSTVMDDLVTDSVNIDNYNQIQNCQLSIWMPPRGTERWGDPCEVIQMMDNIGGYDI